jgi:CheY-like chemotaxis protein
MIKILVVDDEPDVEMMFRQKFRSELKNGNYEMKFVLSAHNALEYMQTLNPFDIVLVLSDINMPEMSGFELLKQIRFLFPELSVFMITAYGDKQNHDQAMQLGANDFLTKPVDFQSLKHLISTIIAN